MHILIEIITSIGLKYFTQFNSLNP